jgi:hypothetical protein
MINRETVERYWTAFKDGDLDAYEACLATDVVVTYPQSGEVLRGRADYMSTIRNYPVNLPSGEEELARLDISEKAISMPSASWIGMSTIAVMSEGSVAVGQSVLSYPNGDTYKVCSIFHLAKGLITSETTYFAAPFDAPEWRSEWVTSDRPVS